MIIFAKMGFNQIKLINWIIQIAGWFFFIANPLYFNADKFSHHPLQLSAFIVQHILLVIFFYFNYYYLIPKILYKKNLQKYLLATILTCIVLLLLLNFIPLLILHPPKFFFSFRFFIAIVQLYAISTTLRLLVDSLIEKQRKQKLEKEMREAEIAFLRSQINPHFLFNTLNNITSLIRFNPEKAEKAVITLSDLMRYMLNNGKVDKIKLTEEIDYLKNYIDLQKLRLPTDFNIKTDFSLTNRAAQIEPLLLISLIENAFKHAVSGNSADFIHINLIASENELNLLILNSLHAEAQNKNVESGIGLQNVKKRLELCYPDKYVLETKGEKEIFTTKLKIKLV